ncbi:MAG: hypothetical protein JXB49_33275 [Bacteroidales bacterium]|nr:hypothetical protein [Bacteroidales bacterium]
MEKWIKVTKKLEISEHDTPDIKDAKKIKYWIKCIPYANLNKFNELNKYEIYDGNIESCRMAEFKLEARHIQDEANKSNAITSYIEDGYGKIRQRIFTGNFKEDRIKDLVAFLKKYGSIKSWDAIERQEKIEELNLKIEELEDQIISLKDEIERKK